MESDREPILEIDAGAEAVTIPALDLVLEPRAVAAPGAIARKKPTMLFLVGSLVGGNFVSMTLRMIGGILQARCVLPAVLGMYNSIGLVLGYAPFLQLGILNGINRELPYFIGKGDHQRVNELAAAAQAWALAVGGTVCLALAGVGCWQLVHGEWELAAGWFTNAVLGFLLFYNTNYLQMTYRTSHDFARLAVANVIENTIALALVAAVALLNFYGLCLRGLLTGLASVALHYYWLPLRVSPRWSRQHLMHLLKIGAPIFVVGQVYSWWAVFDATLVFAYMGDLGMGLYAMVLVAGGAMELLPLAVSQIIYPRMAEQYGRTGRLSDLIRMSAKPILVSTIGLVPLIAVGWLLMDPVVRLILPKYVEAVPAMRWSIIVPLCSSFGAVNSVFPVLRRLGLYAVAIVLGIAVYGGSVVWLTRNGVSLVAFPQAMLIGRATMTLVCYLFIAWLVHRDRAHAAGN